MLPHGAKRSKRVFHHTPIVIFLSPCLPRAAFWCTMNRIVSWIDSAGADYNAAAEAQAASRRRQFEHVRCLCARVGVPCDEPVGGVGDAPAAMRRLANECQRRRAAVAAFSPAAAAGVADAAPRPAVAGMAAGIDLSQYPLGFTTGDEAIDRAAVVLRVSYLADLRQLQDDVNELLVTAQEYTANPVTNAHLGKVGR